MSYLFTLKEGVKGLGRARLASFITISSISFALLLIGFFIIFSLNINHWIDEFRSKIELEVFIEADLQNIHGIEIQKKIKALQGVGQVDFISKEQAGKRFEQEFGRNVKDILGTNPLPASCTIKLKPGFQTINHITALASQIYQIDGVSDIVYHRDFILLVTRYINLIYLIGGGMVILLIFIAMVLIYNTIRLTIFARSDIIEIMKLVGATRGFVRRPFVVEGFLQGGIGAMFSVIILYGIVSLIKNVFYPFIMNPLEVYGALILLGIFTGVLSSKMSISRYLREI